MTALRPFRVLMHLCCVYLSVLVTFIKTILSTLREVYLNYGCLRGSRALEIGQLTN
jgi:hypothetical protein